MSWLWLGVDMAQRDFEGGLWVNAHGRKLGSFSNRASGFDKLAARLERIKQESGAEGIHLVVEPTGGYELRLVAFAFEQGWRVSLPNPARVREWAGGVGYRSKTDSQDALMLAQFGAQTNPQPEQPLSPEVAQLDTLLRRRQDLQQLLQQEKNRQHALGQQPEVAEAVPTSVEALIAYLEEALAQIERAIQQHLKEHPTLKDEARRLQTVPGIGDKTVLPILVLLYRWHARTAGTGSAKGITAFVGLDVRDFRSGSSVYKRPRISKMGDPTIRQFLFMGAFGGVRGNNHLRSFYQRLVGRGKAKRLALVAAARKLLVWAWMVFSTKSDFDPSRAEFRPAA